MCVKEDVDNNILRTLMFKGDPLIIEDLGEGKNLALIIKATIGACETEVRVIVTDVDDPITVAYAELNAVHTFHTPQGLVKVKTLIMALYDRLLIGGTYEAVL